MNDKKPVNKKGVSIAEKQQANQFLDPGFSSNPYELGPEIKEELERKGLAARFVSVKKLQENNGFHPKGWRPYKPESGASTNSDFLFGGSSDGYIRRGDLVLAIKTKEEARRHRAYLDNEADQKNVNKTAKRRQEQLKNYVKDSGMDKYMSVAHDEEQ